MAQNRRCVWVAGSSGQAGRSGPTMKPLASGGAGFIGQSVTLKSVLGSGGIRTHASEETGALNQRLRPLGHATLRCKSARHQNLPRVHHSFHRARRCGSSTGAFNAARVTKCYIGMLGERMAV